MCSGWDWTRDLQSQVQRPNHYATAFRDLTNRRTNRRVHELTSPANWLSDRSVTILLRSAFATLSRLSTCHAITHIAIQPSRERWAPIRPVHSLRRPCLTVANWFQRGRWNCETASEMTYIVSGGALNSTHSLTWQPGTAAPCPLRWFRLPSVLRLDVEENDWTVRESVPTSTTAGATIRTDVCDGRLWGDVNGGIFPVSNYCADLQHYYCYVSIR